MKILIVMPWDLRHRRYRNIFSRLTAYAPLTLPTLAGLIPKELGFEVDACDEMIEDIEKYYNIKYDIVLISFITPSCNRAYKIANDFKNRGAYIVFGGYHTTFIPEEVKEHADTIIIGEAEVSLPMFFNDYINGSSKEIYHYPDVKEIDRKRPDRSILKKHKYSGVPTMIASKGCPNNCEFCAINKMSNNVPRCIEDVIGEIKSLRKRYFIFFDPNFFGNRQYAINLMNEMMKLKIKWMGAATINSAFDEELMDLAQKSGCIGLLVGLESVNEKSLEGVNKKFADPNRYKEAISIMQKHGISVNGCFVLGFDTDTEEELLSLPNQAEYLNLNLVRYSILTPTPNSSLFKKLESEGRIITKDWSKYTQNEVVFTPENISKEKLEEIYKYVWKESYKLKNIYKRIKNMQNVSFYQKFIVFAINIGFKFVGNDEYK